MATATALSGNTIGDIVLNNSGLLSNWNAFLIQNEFADWTPVLFSGQVLEIPADITNDAAAIAALKQYPANNASAGDIYQQIDDIFNLLSAAMPTIAPIIARTIKDNNTYYSVRNGEGVVDVVLNSTGSILNWFEFINANEYDTWTPNLFSGEIVVVSSEMVPSLNNFRALNTYPANNFSVPDINQQINAVFDLLNNPLLDWILYNPDGFWNDTSHYWRDGARWLD